VIKAKTILILSSPLENRKENTKENHNGKKKKEKEPVWSLLSR
jgi:hypothetical protein